MSNNFSHFTPSWLHNFLSVLTDGHSAMALGLLTAFVFAIAAAWILRRRFEDRLEASVEAHSAWLDRLEGQALPLVIFVASALLLFSELMIIRIHASFFQIFGYYKNVSLLSCFLGLGVGFTRGSVRRVLTPLVIPGLALQVCILGLLRYTAMEGILQNPVPEYVAMGLEQSGKGLTNFLSVVFSYFFLCAVFVGNALCFVPLGHLTARVMYKFDAVSAYGWNLLGSLAGIIFFTALSFCWAPPAVWFGLFVVVLILFFLRDGDQLLPSAISSLVCLIILSFGFNINQKDIYSPYQILSLISNRDGRPEIRVNNVYFQTVADLRPTSIERSGGRSSVGAYYDAPYALRPQAQDVLIVGSGSGNDVAAALRHNVGHVDAVEIDPVIVALGRLLHPEAPYDSPKVSAHITDARGFLRRSAHQYDLIVFGYLDSHSLLASLSSVRLDSFVYTVESFRMARHRLKDDGVLCLTFASAHDKMGGKLFKMITMAFDGKEPVVYDSGLSGYTFCSTDSPTSLTTADNGLRVMGDTVRTAQEGVEPSTDDWPFFYMMNREYPTSYLVMMVMLMFFSFAFCRRMAPGITAGISLPCFFLGAGFMLVETKAITELALVFGSTWIVVSIVIAAILGMAYLSNCLVARGAALPDSVVYSLIIGTLVIGYFLPHAQLVSGTGALSDIAAVTFVTIPIFLAGLVFSKELKSAGVDRALSSNLMGAMLGGFLEYNSLYFGYQALYLLAALLYALAYFGRFRISQD